MECILKIDLQVTCGPHVHACVWCALKRGGKETETYPSNSKAAIMGAANRSAVFSASCSNGFSGAATKLATMAAIVSSAVS